jgi:hypothetical protein
MRFAFFMHLNKQSPRPLKNSNKEIIRGSTSKFQQEIAGFPIGFTEKAA